MLLVLMSIAVLAGCAAPGHFETPGAVHGPNCPAIDAARAIEFSGDRARAFSRIARQPDLMPHELAFLTEAATDGRLFSGDAAGVLVAVAKHPHATDQTRREVGERVKSLDLFSADRARVAAALVVASDEATSEDVPASGK